MIKAQYMNLISNRHRSCEVTAVLLGAALISIGVLQEKDVFHLGSLRFLGILRKKVNVDMYRLTGCASPFLSCIIGITLTPIQNYKNTKVT